MVNFTTARREPAALSSGWNSVSLAITFTPAMAAGPGGGAGCDVQRHGGQDARHAPLGRAQARPPRSAPARPPPAILGQGSEGRGDAGGGHFGTGLRERQRRRRRPFWVGEGREGLMPPAAILGTGSE